MPTENDWWIIFRRALGVPDIINEEHGRSCLVDRALDFGPPDAADRSEVESVLKKLVELGSSGELDRYFMAPAGGPDDFDEHLSSTEDSLNVPSQSARTREILRHVVDYVNAHGPFRADRWHVAADQFAPTW